VDQEIVGTWFDGFLGRLLHCSYFVGPGRSTMSVPLQCWPVVTTVSIDVFSPCTTNIKKESDPSRAYRTREPATSLWGGW
jgi:hypothetical protein